MKVTQAQISQNYAIAQQQNQLLETKLKESEEANSKLDSDLQVASLQIVSSLEVLCISLCLTAIDLLLIVQVDLEMKLQAAEKVNRNEKEANK